MSTSTAPISLTLRRLALARDGGGLSDGRLLGEFVRTADPAAFEQLVRRHGPMVLGVCRRVVRDRHAAEDAFQAVWLVLARRAADVRPREHVGGWLFGVAYRTALKARGARARRYAREKQVTAMRHPESPARSAAWADVAPVLDAELARLPDALRLPVVLCDLEGRPQRDAARHLGLPVTTLVNRLLRARRALAKRLTDRGIALTGGALAVVLGTHGAAQAVPPALAAAAVAGATAGAAPAAAVYLSEGVLRMMALSRLKPALAAVMTAVGLSVGVGTAVLPTAAGQSPAAEKKPLAAGPLDDDAFLRRACDVIRGTPATDLERALFKLDADPKKRAKVVEWLLAEPVPVAVRADRTALVKWLLMADGSLRKVDPSTVGKGGAWFGSQPEGKVNPNDWLVQGVGEIKPDDPAGTIPLIDPGSWRARLLPYIQEPADPPKPAAEPPANPTNKRVEQFLWQMAQPRAEVKKADGKPATADQARAEIDKARIEVMEAKQKVEKAESDRKRAEKGANAVDSDLARIDLEVARARLAEAQARLEKATAQPAPPEKPNGVVAEVVADPPAEAARRQAVYDLLQVHDAATPDDATFLRRVLQDALGKPPTALELKYFTEDKDPQKREKVLDLLLKDAAVAKKLGPDWRNKVLGLPVPWKVEVVWADDVVGKLGEIEAAKVGVADPFAKLLVQVLDGKRTDEQIADAICLATVGRFPTEAEQRMALAAAAGAKDKRAAWSHVVQALAGTKEAQAHAEALKKK
jgi:RNA polymerase sigma factor (sigma-70 family)